MSTASSFQNPRGLSESLGQAILDMWRVVREPGMRYWPVTAATVVRLVKSAGPLAWLLCFFQGTFIVIQTSVILGGFGVDRGLGGLIVSGLGLRELVLISGTSALGASIGAGFVTELGSMRVSEEIDAIEVMGISSYSYLVSTRVVAAVIAAIPIFAGAIAMAFLGAFVSANFQAMGLNRGSYSSWFNLGLSSPDIIFVMIKGIVASALVAGICSSTGYRAKGGPVGVGMAVGEALNLTLVVVMVVNLLMSYLFWGISDTVKL